MAQEERSEGPVRERRRETRQDGLEQRKEERAEGFSSENEKRYETRRDGRETNETRFPRLLCDPSVDQDPDRSRNSRGLLIEMLSIDLWKEERKTKSASSSPLLSLLPLSSSFVQPKLPPRTEDRLTLSASSTGPRPVRDRLIPLIWHDESASVFRRIRLPTRCPSTGTTRSKSSQLSCSLYILLSVAMFPTSSQLDLIDLSSPLSLSSSPNELNNDDENKRTTHSPRTYAIKSVS